MFKLELINISLRHQAEEETCVHALLDDQSNKYSNYTVQVTKH